MKKLIKIAAFSALSIAASPSAQAEGLSDCASINDHLDRLTCYDEVSGRIPKTETVEIDSLWRTSITQSEWDDSDTVVIEVAADNAINCGAKPEDEETPALVLRCEENRTSIHIATECDLTTGLGDLDEVDMRVDNREAFTIRARNSSQHQGFGLWNGEKSIPKIKKLFGGKELITRFNPFLAGQQKVTFPIAGIEEAIKPLRKACHW